MTTRIAGLRIAACVAFAGTGAIAPATAAARAVAAQEPADPAIPAAEAPTLETQIASMLDRARPALRRHLADAERGKLALVCLAALHDGMDPEQVPLRGALHRLLATGDLDSYGLSLRAMCVGLLDATPERLGVLADDTTAMLRHQARAGWFGYGADAEPGDLSNTQFVAMALRVVVRRGCEVPAEALARMLDATLAAQEPDGGFAYRPDGRHPATLSMTVAGITVLEVAVQIHTPAAATRERVRRALDAAWRWVDRHVEQVGDSRVPYCLYMHWGLERAAILSERDAVGGVDWHARGARLLQSLELSHGGFAVGRGATRLHDAATLTDTAFGVLFLRRQFQRRIDGPTTGNPTWLCHTLPERASASQIDTAIELDVQRGHDAVPNLLEAMRTGSPLQRWAAVRALRRISERDFGYVPDSDARENAEALRRAERWWIGVRARR